MQRLIIITCILILGFVSPILCRFINDDPTKMGHFNVIDYGAHGDGTNDDSNAILSAWKDVCGAEEPATLVIPRRKIFLVTVLKINGPCKTPSVSIKLAGKIVPPSKDGWVSDRSSWIVISDVNNLTIDGRGGLIDGKGSTWWDTCNKNCSRPTALRLRGCNNLTVNFLRMSNSPGAHISVNGCNGAIFSHMNIKAPPHSPNTDGFDIAGSQNILIQNSTIGTGDDCIAINGGSSNINATRLACGPGHGISIGSLGRNYSREIVEDVYVRNCSFTRTTNGARIKTWPGGSGYARRIVFDQIILREVENAIIIDQYYGFKTPIHTDEAVMVSEVTYRGFNGTSVGDDAINLKCSTLGCFNITLDDIHIISSQANKPTHAFCENVHGTFEDTLPKVSCISQSPSSFPSPSLSPFLSSSPLSLPFPFLSSSLSPSPSLLPSPYEGA
ncbi:hypothetical protein VNO78_26274 [Psophocarpus tetragonolobus]|uniref:Polygalacturonase n=1 Tax=Psophocarpus tetragonolobus TaxID=3891 RepID=A0AAN9S1R9_PSOTE